MRQWLLLLLLPLPPMLLLLLLLVAAVATASAPHACNPDPEKLALRPNKLPLQTMWTRSNTPPSIFK